MLTHRNRNLGLLKAMRPSFATATSKIVMQTVNLDVDVPKATDPFNTKLTNFGLYNPMCSINCHDLAMKKFSELKPNRKMIVCIFAWTFFVSLFGCVTRVEVE